MNRFNIHISGDKNKPKLAFLHGLMGSGSNWRAITPLFKENFQILTYDQRGHGRSFAPLHGFAPEDYADDLNDILTDLGWKTCILVGHSMGARAALSFAARHPDKTNVLVLEDISMISKPSLADQTKKLINLVPAPFKNRSEARNFFKNKLIGLLIDHPNPEALSQYLYTNLKEVDGGQIDWRFSKKGIFETLDFGRKKSRWEDFNKVNCPFMVIRGGDSNEITDEEALEMVQRQPSLVLKTIEGAGHWVHYDKPKEFKLALHQFLLISLK